MLNFLNDVFEMISSSKMIMDSMMLLLTVVLGMGTTLFTYKSKNKMDISMMKNEGEEIDKALQKVQIVYNQMGKKHDVSEKNILNMMIDNVSELREYYVISKQQARKSFSAALFICFFGIFIYLLGISAYIFVNKDITLISIIGGTIVEVIAGLFFWLYREATKQLGVYHQRLGSTEKYLTVIQIIKEMPKDKQVETYNNLISSILSDNRAIITHENRAV